MWQNLANDQIRVYKGRVGCIVLFFPLVCVLEIDHNNKKKKVFLRGTIEKETFISHRS